MNPYNPMKPGQFNFWREHAETHGDPGVGKGTTHESFINKPSAGGWGSPSSSPGPTYTSTSGHGPGPTYTSPSAIGSAGDLLKGAGASGGSAGDLLKGIVGWVVVVFVLGAIFGGDNKQVGATTTQFAGQQQHNNAPAAANPPAHLQVYEARPARVAMASYAPPPAYFYTYPQQQIFYAPRHAVMPPMMIPRGFAGPAGGGFGRFGHGGRR